jgi:hypothetical protein
MSVFTYSPDNSKDNNRRSFVADKDGHSARNTLDKLTHDKLDLVIAALGGSVDTTPTIYNVDCSVSGTEYSQALPANTKGFILRARKNSKIEFAYSSGASSHLTIPVGNSFEDRNMYSSVQTLYFKCSKADEIVEIVAYV